MNNDWIMLQVAKTRHQDLLKEAQSSRLLKSQHTNKPLLAQAQSKLMSIGSKLKEVAMPLPLSKGLKVRFAGGQSKALVADCETCEC